MILKQSLTNNKTDHGWFRLAINTNKDNDDIRLINEDGTVLINRSQTKEEDFCLDESVDKHIIVSGCL